MDTVPLVEYKIDAGQRLLDRLGEEGFVVRAACWVKPSDRDRWSLYIATPEVKERVTLQAYRRLTPVMRSLGDDWITSSDVVVVGEEHPLAQYALDVLRRFPHRKPIPSPRPLLGGISVEEVYVYPVGKTPVTIYGLVFPGEPTGASHLSLEPYPDSARFSIEVENNGTRQVYPAKTGIDWVVAAPEGARLERNADGQMVLVWELHGNKMESRANEVWSLAKLGLHGFRFLDEPNGFRTST
jgi:hypothetical protein